MSKHGRKNEVPAMIIGEITPVSVPDVKPVQAEPVRQYAFPKEPPCPNCGGVISREKADEIDLGTHKMSTLATSTQGGVQIRKCLVCKKSFKVAGTLVKF